MTRIIMCGCNGKMGRVISQLVKEDENAEIVAGVDISGEQLDRLNKWFDDITEAIRRAADVLTELFKKLADAVTPVLSKAVDSLKELFDNLDLNDYDDKECYQQNWKDVFSIISSDGSL